MNIKEQIIISLGKKIWGITPIDCAYMQELLMPLSEDDAKAVYRIVVNSERINLNTFTSACRKVKGEAISSHEAEAKALLNKLYKVVDKINWERKINNFIRGEYPLESITINEKPAFSAREIEALRMAHKNYKDLVQYKNYNRVIENVCYLSIKFWLLGVSEGRKALAYKDYESAKKLFIESQA